MEEIINKIHTLDKITRKLNILNTLLSEEEPSYELKIIGDYEPISIDIEISKCTIISMIKKYSKLRKMILKEFKLQVKTLK